VRKRDAPPQPHVGAQIPIEMRAALEAEAERRHVSISDVLRWAIEYWQARPEATTEKAS
jgi:hypothetical protein